ncbi:hypothetical protein Hanom_Chr05g00386151 [Helianthus anomalus]
MRMPAMYLNSHGSSYSNRSIVLKMQPEKEHVKNQNIKLSELIICFEKDFKQIFLFTGLKVVEKI